MCPIPIFNSRLYARSAFFDGRLSFRSDDPGLAGSSPNILCRVSQSIFPTRKKVQEEEKEFEGIFRVLLAPLFFHS